MDTLEANDERSDSGDTAIEHDGEDGTDQTRGPARFGPFRRWGISFVLLAAVVALAGGVFVLTGESEDSSLLVRNGDGSISLIDPATGVAAFEVKDAVPTPDLSSLLTTRASGRNTVLESRDARSGSVTGTTSLEGGLEVRSVSPAGGAVVLMAPRDGAGLYEPESRTSTQLTVAFLDDRPALRFDLDANIEPEMVSLDETTLFVLEFVPPTDPTGYFVRKLDLATGVVTDTDSIQVDLTSKMAGKARAQSLHPDGTFLYTLYTLPGSSPVHDGAAGRENERFAFVHVISLDEKWSFCIFLPVPFGTTDEATIGMTVSADGETLLVADPAIGKIAEIDVEEMSVTEVHDVDRIRDSGEKAVVAMADDGAIFAGSGNVVLELDPESYAPIFAWSTQGVLTGVSVTKDELRVAGGGSVTLVDRATRQETAVVGSKGHGPVDLLGPPQGSVVEFPLECAC